MVIIGQADYMREWRKTPAGVRALRIQKQRANARRKALADLEAQHQAEYNRLYAEYLGAEDAV